MKTATDSLSRQTVVEVIGIVLLLALAGAALLLPRHRYSHLMARTNEITASVDALQRQAELLSSVAEAFLIEQQFEFTDLWTMFTRTTDVMPNVAILERRTASLREHTAPHKALSFSGLSSDIMTQLQTIASSEAQLSPHLEEARSKLGEMADPSATDFTEFLSLAMHTNLIPYEQVSDIPPDQLASLERAFMVFAIAGSMSAWDDLISVESALDCADQEGLHIVVDQPDSERAVSEIGGHSTMDFRVRRDNRGIKRAYAIEPQVEESRESRRTRLARQWIRTVSELVR